MLGVAAFFSLLLVSGSSLEIACHDALTPWACSRLNNSDNEECCWCSDGKGSCHPASKSSSCSSSAICTPTPGRDPCESRNNTCSNCTSVAGCGWCGEAPSCSSGVSGEAFPSTSCGAGVLPPPWVSQGGSCPAPLAPDAPNWDGNPLPPWFHMGAGVALMVFCTGMAFAGYKLFRVSIIAVGTGAAGLPVFVYAYDNLPISGDNTALGVAGVLAGLAALLGGVLCWRLFKVGVFILGGSLGAITALLLQILVFARFLPALGNIPLIVAGVALGVGVGALSLVAARPTMIIATSVLGAYGAIRGVSMLVPNTFLGELTLAKRVQAGETLPATMDGYLGGIAAMALVGALVQFFVTAAKKGKGGDKDDLEKELEDSEISLEALQGKTKKKKGSKEKKSKGKGKKGAKAGNKLKNDALLRDYEEGGEFFEGGYDEAWVGEEGEEDYSQEHYELPPVPPTNAAPAKKSWWSRGKKGEEPGKGGGGSLNSSTASNSKKGGGVKTVEW